MSQGEDPAEIIQGGVTAILMGYILLKFFNVFPSGDIVNGPFSLSYLIISLIPWLLVFLGIVLLLSMFLEVTKF